MQAMVSSFLLVVEGETMGYMDMLKNAAGLSPSNEPRQIDADKHYTFVPGPNGSLTAPADKPDTDSADSKRIPAKVVPIKPQTAAVRG